MAAGESQPRKPVSFSKREFNQVLRFVSFVLYSDISMGLNFIFSCINTEQALLKTSVNYYLFLFRRLLRGTCSVVNAIVVAHIFFPPCDGSYVERNRKFVVLIRYISEPIWSITHCLLLLSNQGYAYTCIWGFLLAVKG